MVYRRAEVGRLKPIALASYPGSGNTWLRWMIEAASGISTGSIYYDVDLYFKGNLIFFPSIEWQLINFRFEGFWGELTDWDSGQTLVQKTHDSSFDHIQSFSNGKGILICRNPYDALISFHNFLYGGHVGYAPDSNYKRKGPAKRSMNLLIVFATNHYQVGS